MIALVLLFMLGMLLPFVVVYGALAWLLALPLLGAWQWGRPYLSRVHIKAKHVRMGLTALSVLIWAMAIRSVH